MKEVDRTLFTLVSILIGISIIVNYSLSSYVTILFETNQFHFVIRQASFGLLGIIIMWILAQLNPDKWLVPIGLLIFVTSSLLMVAMTLFLPESIVPIVGGAKRWIKIMGFSLAPVEFFKVGFVLFLAWSFSRKLGHHNNMGILKELHRFAPYAVIFIGAVVMIAHYQKDFGQTAVLSTTLLIMLIFAGSSFRFFLVLVLPVMAALIFYILIEPHRINRIKSWWSLAQYSILDILPESIAQHLRIPVENIPYQIGHSLNAISNGGFFGTGLGNGTFKLGFLSEVHTDFVLSGITEEFGFIGLLVVCGLMILIIQRIFKIANRTDDTTIYLFSLGIALLFSFSFLINAYGISGLTPIKGISVPFLSYGGSAMIASCIGVGMVLMGSKKEIERNKI